jgi:peptide/nickel transport system substrate-binding protein
MNVNTEVSPQVVEGATTEDDGRRWTLTLRPGLMFHDGEPVLARDCAVSIQRWGTTGLGAVAPRQGKDQGRGAKVAGFGLPRQTPTH